ncbi:uncharacterized protein LOC128161791 isoform X2 [Crassostrea angulata]|uniref:uncharacterized protein LOC128161791 isoform X2 n=1 Tax=Magallana angulata TaxID=2784310 RepID=UPI0022B16DB0|nr:uncharacterized protein LOC128161791 isoform X2 [Crassostrea angulata]
MDLRTDQKCLIYELQSRTFELRCNYTGYSPRLDVILTSLPRLYNVQGSTDNLMSLILPVRGINQQKSFYLNKSCELTVDDYLYKIEFEKECETTLSAETKVSAETENHLPYTLGLVCTAFVVVIIIVTFLVLKKKVESLNNGECHWNSSGLQHTNPENTVTTRTLHNELLRSSGSQASIATQDIEYSMIELNFGSPLNNLNK